MILATKCQVCHVPMAIDYEPNDFFSKETVMAMATCNACYTRRENRFRRAKASPSTTRGNLPYKD